MGSPKTDSPVKHTDKGLATPSPLLSMLIGYILLTYLATIIAIVIGSDTPCTIMFVILSLFGMVIYLVYNREREIAAFAALEEENKRLRGMVNTTPAPDAHVIVKTETIADAEKEAEQALVPDEKPATTVTTEPAPTVDEAPAAPATTEPAAPVETTPEPETVTAPEPVATVEATAEPVAPAVEETPAETEPSEPAAK